MKRNFMMMITFLLISSSVFGWLTGKVLAKDGFGVTINRSFQVSSGVSHESFRLTIGHEHSEVQMLEVDLQDPFVEVIPYTSNGEIYGLETVGNMMKEKIEQGENVVGGVNGDFFSSVGVPSGLQMVDGEIFTSPRNMKALIYFTEDKRAVIDDNVQMTAEISVGESKLELDMVNRSRVPSHNDRAFLFNYRFGPTTKTPDGGIEVVIDVGDHDKLRAGQTIEGIVESIEETSDTPIERGKIVLSGVGTKADWLVEHLQIGTKVQLDINFTKGVNEATHVLSANSTLGTLLLKDGEIYPSVLDTSNSNNTDKNPRTMLATKNGKLYIFAIDGRQPGYSDGISLIDAARYLQSLGMEDAINIDGGGSTTYYVKQPGEHKLRLLNRPSDGHERPVGNSLLVISQAPKENQLAGLALYPTTEPLKIVAGSEIRFYAKGYDQYLNPINVEPKQLQWSVVKGIGKIDSSGLFTAGKEAQTGEIIVQKGDIKTTKDVVVTNQVATLDFSSSSYVVDPGKKFEFNFKAYDEEGNQLIISPNLLNWTVEGDIGVISADGILEAVDYPTSGKVIASYNDIRIEANVMIGPATIIEDFEDTSHIRSHEVRTVPGSVQMSLVEDPEFVLFGERVAQLTYDFTGTTGTSAAYIQLLNDEGVLGKEIPGEPTQVGLWVYGDAKYHQIRLGIIDGNGENVIWNMTTIGGVNWTGWQYVYAVVPEDTVFPVKVRYIAYEEKNNNNKTAGLLYFDQLQALYSDRDHMPNIEILLDNYAKEEMIHHSVKKQLENKLRQAKHHESKGSLKQRDKFLNDFLKILNDPKNDKKIAKGVRLHLQKEIVKAFDL